MRCLLPGRRSVGRGQSISIVAVAPVESDGACRRRRSARSRSRRSSGRRGAARGRRCGSARAASGGMTRAIISRPRSRRPGAPSSRARRASSSASRSSSRSACPLTALPAAPARSASGRCRRSSSSSSLCRRLGRRLELDPQHAVVHLRALRRRVDQRARQEQRAPPAADLRARSSSPSRDQLHVAPAR